MRFLEATLHSYAIYNVEKNLCTRNYSLKIMRDYFHNITFKILNEMKNLLVLYLMMIIFFLKMLFRVANFVQKIRSETLKIINYM